MKLLFDQNVSPRLASLLADLFPDCAHVENLGLGTSDDLAIWQYAKANDYVIVSKDEDFNLLSVARGTPPKVLWLLLGNCKTSEIEAAIRCELAAIQQFEADPNAGTLVIR
jgi:predicted nuclease of predicted toxin-antitoxin system